MMRTAVVLELTIPMAASSAMMAERVSAGVSPGTAIMSRPTEQTQVMASSLSRVHNAEGGVQPAAGLLGHQLTHAGDAEGGLLHRLGYHVEGLSLHLLKGVVYHTRAGDPHVDDPLWLAHPVEGARHKGVVLHGVAEHHQLGAAEAAPVGSFLRQLLDGAAHEGHRVHIDARLGGAHVDRGADDIRRGQRLGDGVDEDAVGRRHPLLDQGGEAADEVDATRAMGVTEMRLLTMGMPNSFSMSSPVATSLSA